MKEKSTPLTDKRTYCTIRAVCSFDLLEFGRMVITSYWFPKGNWGCGSSTKLNMHYNVHIISGILILLLSIWNFTRISSRIERDRKIAREKYSKLFKKVLERPHDAVEPLPTRTELSKTWAEGEIGKSRSHWLSAFSLLTLAICIAGYLFWIA